MVAKRTKAQAEADRRNSTRDLMRELPAFCNRRGFVMPAEFLVCVMNGEDPRVGKDVEVDPITIQESLNAANTLAKYCYATASQVDITSGHEPIPRVVVDANAAAVFAKKIEAMFDKPQDALSVEELSEDDDDDDDLFD